MKASILGAYHPPFPSPERSSTVEPLVARNSDQSRRRWVQFYDPRCAHCPVLMAGQVLEHLTSHSELARSEVCHLFDLVGRGYAGFVLSNETAVGINPVGAVPTLRSLLDS